MKTIKEIAKEFDVHPVQVPDWKKTMLEGAAGVFGGAAAASPGRDDFERERGQLHAKIGQITMEKDFLEKSPDSPVCEGTGRAGGENHPHPGVRRQCALWGVARSPLSYQPVPESAEDRRIKALLDRIYLGVRAL